MLKYMNIKRNIRWKRLTSSPYFLAVGTANLVPNYSQLLVETGFAHTVTQIKD